MGVFIISPVDKGGKLFQPSVPVARAIGPSLTPIAFAALHAWKSVGAHTVSEEGCAENNNAHFWRKFVPTPKNISRSLLKRVKTMRLRQSFLSFCLCH